MSVFTIFFQMLALLLIIFAGCFMAKTGMMDEHTNSQMSGMIVNVFNPLLIFASAANSVGMVSMDKMKSAGLCAVGMFLVFIAAGRIFAPLFDKAEDQRKLFQMMFIFSNVGFIGIPVVSGILGEAYIVYVTEFMLVYNFVFYTYGIALMDGTFSAASLRQMVNPGMAFSLAAMFVIIFEIQVPDFLKTSATYLGNVTSPMALAAVGYTLAHSDLKKIFGQPRLYVFAAIKLLIFPLLILPVLKMAVDDSALLQLCMIMLGMPIGNMPLILGTQKGIDSTACSAAIILTTVLCVITIPVLMAVTM